MGSLPSDDSPLRLDDPNDGWRPSRGRSMLSACCWSWRSSRYPSSDSSSSVGTWSAARRSSAMQFDDVLGLVLTIAGLAYLIFAMLRPEKF